MAAHRTRLLLSIVAGVLLASTLLPVAGADPVVAAHPAAATLRPSVLSLPSARGDSMGTAIDGRESAADRSTQVPAEVPIASFEGLVYGANGPHPNRVAPPDVQVAAGPGHVVEMVNLAARWWTKDGTEVRTLPLRDFFGVPSTEFISDPKVRYDAPSGRWFASITDVNASAILLAVSESDDPTGSWDVHSFVATAGCADQPLLGMTEDKVILSANDFSTCTSAGGFFVGVEYWVINKADLVVGGTPRFQRFGPDSSMFSLHPAHALGSTATAYLATAGNGGTDALTVLAVSGTPPGPVTIVSKRLSISRTAEPPGAPQLGTLLLLDASDARVQDSIWEAGHLWVALDDACTPAGDLLNRACIRLIDVDTSSFAVVQDFDFGINGKYVFYPAIRTDLDGRLIVVFGSSSATDYPSVMTASRSPSDPPATIGPPTLLRAGTGAEKTHCTTTCRYGDYFGAARDPVDPGVVWVGAEYGRSTGWATFVAAIATTVHMRVSYSILGGGSGYQPPILSYVEGGIPRTTALSTDSVTLSADAGTTWSVPGVLDGSGSAERWTTELAATGPARGFEPIHFMYTHQYLASFRYRITGGGSGYSAPMVGYVQLGASRSSAANLTDWADANSAYAFPILLDGSNESLRWRADPAAASGFVAGPVSIEVAYGHQAFVSFEVQGTAGASILPGSGWYDVGSVLQPTAKAPAGWAVGEWIGAGPGAYSGPIAAPQITVQGPFADTAILYPGLTITAGFGGSVTYSYGDVNGSVAGGASRTLYVRPGTNVSLRTSASTGFGFAGWSGAASGGRPDIVVTVASPTTLTASFALTPLAVAALAAGIGTIGFLATLAVVVVRRRSPPRLR